MMGITISTRTKGDTEILEIDGRIINIESDKFKARLDSFCKKGQKKVVVDLSKVDFIDSFGLGALVGHHTLLQKEGRDLVILNANPNAASYIRRLFEMTSLDTIFTIIDTEESL